MRVLRVLIGCEYSGVVRRAFRKLGHDAWSCDLIPAEDGPFFHYTSDVMEVIKKGWDIGIFHPPCTYILNSGCKHLYQGMRRFNPDGTENPRNESRWAAMIDGAMFFKDCLNANIPHVACENPIMVGHAQKIVGEKWEQKINPWWFGHPESKATCLWLRNLPPLIPTKIVYEEMMKLPKKERERIHYMSPGKNRGHERSRTYDGIADAMADQWSAYVAGL